MTSMMRSFGTLAAHQRPTVGDTKTSVVNDDHLGWLKCDGRALSTANFYSLFRVIGYSFGVSGDDFLLPNAAGRVAGMIGTGPASTTWSLGDVSGAYTHTLDISEMPSHTHTSNATGGATGLAQRTGSNTLTESDSSSGELDLVNAAALTINATGENKPFSVMQPTIFMGNMFIYAGRPEYGAWPFQAGLTPPML